jgi:hypothetical protein
MASVYLGKDPALKWLVAVKVLRAGTTCRGARLGTGCGITLPKNVDGLGSAKP